MPAGLLCTLLAAAPQGVEAPSLEIELGAGERLAAYAWDGGPEVPAGGATGSLTIPYGEAGKRILTAAYLNFPDGGAEGRYGRGAELASAEERLSLVEGWLRPPFAVDLWIRPSAEPIGERERVITAEGAFAIDREGDGRVVAQLDEGVRLASPDPLLVGEWNHLALTVDGPELNAVRLVVNGRAVGRRRADPPQPCTAEKVVLGGMPCSIDEVRVLGRSLTTDELLERFEPPVEPGEHVLTLKLEDGTKRDVSTWAGVIEKPLLETEDDWRRGARSHLAVRDGGLRWVPGQWRRDRPDLRPPARTTHPTVYVGEHRVFVYGGETRDTHAWPFRNTDDTWIYDAHLRRWARVNGPAPSPRCHQAAAYSPDHELVLLPGGWRNDRRGKETYDDTWVFHVDEERWEKRDPGGVPLPRLSNDAVVYHPELKRFIVFHRRDVYGYDPVEDRWDRVPIRAVDFESGEPYAYDAGSSPMAGYDPETDRFVLFGGSHAGADGLEYGNATAHVDLRAGKVLVKALETAPSPRVRSAFARDSKRGYFVLFGGVQDQFSQRESDLWTYRVAEGRWTRVDAADMPSARGGYYDMAYDPELDVFLVLCGRHAPDRFLNEAWRLRLDPEAEASAAYVFDRAGFPELDGFFATVRGADEEAVRWSFEWSDDGRTWTESTAEPGAETPFERRFLRATVRVAAPRGGAVPFVSAMGFKSRPVARPASSGERTWEWHVGRL